MSKLSSLDKQHPRRIAILSMHTCPLAMLGGKKSGGMNVYVRDLSRELARRGIQIDVFTRSQDPYIPMISQGLGYGARVIHVKAGPEQPLPINDVYLYVDEFAQAIYEFATEENVTYDLIHTHYWLSGLAAGQLREKWPSIPIVHMFHTLGRMKNRVATTDRELAPPERIEGEQKVIEIADRIVVATPAEQAQLHWLYGNRSKKEVVVPPGVDLDKFKPLPREAAKAHVGIPVHDRSILFVGRIEPLKGVDTLLQAMALIQERYPSAVKKVTVTIIGGDPWAHDPDLEMKRLQAMREQLGIRDIVTFIGARDQNELPYYYAAAEIVVMPSHYESFGMVALEAMASGTPVIASEVGGLAFLVQDGENGFHVPSRDPETLAERIYELLVNDSCRERLGRNAREHARKYAWSNIAEKMLEVYDKLLMPAEEKESSRSRHVENPL
ncbi:MAG: glycosyltransferase [Candidatus Promineifilaceae bacterium]